MECEENGEVVRAEAGRRGVKRKRGAGGARDVRLLAAAAGAGRRAPRPRPARAATPPDADQPPLFPPPYANVNLMEEITFWVCTRRAPCLYRYNNVYKKKDEAHCSKYRHSSDPSYADEVPSPKKKKRKLRLLDNESMSSEGQQNVYFERSHKHERSWYSSSKSQSDRSDVDFNIKNSSIRNKTKMSKLQRKNRTTLHKKNKIITSTPKPTTLRRSLRKTQQNLNNTQLNCSLCIFNSKAVNGEHEPQLRENGEELSKSVNRNHTSNSKKGTVLQEQSKNEIVPNGQFEDISDVSGFTANYIRSTKMNSKTPRKARSKPSRNLVRESQHKLQKDESKIIVCVNKSANTGLPNPALNQSTDSSQNVINLVTVNNNNNEKSLRVNQATSQIKLLKNDQVKESGRDETQNLNTSFQSKSSGVSRYPTRHRTNSKTVPHDLENSVNNSTPAKKTSRGVRELKSINQNELYDISLVSRTRSGRKIGVTMDLEESGCSQDQVNNLADHGSLSVTKNVASPVNKSVRRKKRVTSKKTDRGQEIKKDSESDSAKKNSGSLALSPAKCGRRAVDKRQSLKRDSLRDKSGFAACFSDSEEDKPLIQRKFFC